jgi:hypothetical protein
MKGARAIALLFSATGAACGDDSPPPAPRTAQELWFEDVTALSGVDFVHQAGETEERHLPETMGAGAALVDVDLDGDLDLYFVQGGPMRLPGSEPGSFRDPPGEHGALPPNRLYLNDGNGRFTDHTARSGAAAHTGYGMGVTAGDVNGDGHVDLYVTNLGPDVLLLGDGTGAFRDATAEAGIADERWTSGAAFFDAEGDGDPDLYVCGYVLVDLADPEWCGERRPGWRSYCHPDRYPALPDRFWRNRGDGTFEDATQAAGLDAVTPGKGLGVIASDFDLDGDLDLYVANDSTENFLFENDGAGRFSDATLLAGTGVDGRGLTEAGMGLATGDVDGDLDLEIFVTNFDDESNTLYQNDGALLFRDATITAGLEGPSRLPVGFGTVLEDFDADGDLDLAVVNGHIIHNIALYHDGKTHAQRAQVFANDGHGHFTELFAEAAALAPPYVGRGLYAGDLDGDGAVDLVLTGCGEPARILRNRVGPGRALVLRGLPARTRVHARLASGRTLLREAGPQPSYFGASDGAVVIGLARPGSEMDALVELELAVPGRARQRFAFEEPRPPGVLRFARPPEGLVLWP